MFTFIFSALLPTGNFTNPNTPLQEQRSYSTGLAQRKPIFQTACAFDAMTWQQNR